MYLYDFEKNEVFFMITGSLKNKIDAIRQDFYNENMAQGSDVVNQLTTLMFIKMLDDRQNSLEAQAIIAGLTPKQDDLIFKNGNYVNEEENINIPYEKLRWKNFKNLNSKDLSKTIIKWGYDNNDIIRFPDQDTINYLCRDSKIVLPLRYGIK